MNSTKSSWSDININEYQQLLKIPDTLSPLDKTRKVLSICSGKTVSQIKKLSVSEFYALADLCTFVNTPIPQRLHQFFTIKDIKFGIIPNLNDLTIGELYDLENFINNIPSTIS